MPKLALPALVLTLCLPGMRALAADTPDQYALRMELRTPAVAPFYRLGLPLEAYTASASADLQDIRVFNADGTAVPYARLSIGGSTEESIQRSAIPWFPIRAAAGANSTEPEPLNLTVRQGSDGTLISLRSGASSVTGKTPATAQIRGYVLDASKIRERQAIRALSLDWRKGSSDFQLVDVESSDDLQHWAPLASNVQLARLEYNGARIESRRIELPGTAGRYLRLLWREPATAPELSAAEIEQSTARYLPPPLAWSAPLPPETAESGSKPGDYRYHLPRPLPLARLQIDLPPGNQLLPVQILTQPGHQKGWQSIASGVVYRITSKGHEWRNTDIPLGNVSVQDFMLRIDPRLPAPAQAPTLRYAVQPEQLVFLASGTPPFTLATGRRDAQAAALPVSTLVPGYGLSGGPEIASAEVLLTHSQHASSQAAAGSGSNSAGNEISRRYMLWGVLILGVLGMAAMAWQLLRQMKQTPEDKS